MANLISSLYIGASGIYTNQAGIQVSGNNITNANTAGYSRQTAAISSAETLQQGNLIYGTGSTVSTISRTSSTFLTSQLIAQSEIYGEYEAASTPLGDIEEVLNIDDASLATDIDNFFDSWEELSNNPDGVTERQQVLQQAANLAETFNQIDQQLADIVESINISIESEIPSLNENLQQIAQLNISIMQAEAAGSNANTLLDQRDLLVQQVSESCGATMYKDENGMVCLQLPGGQPLVTGKVASSFSLDRVDGLVQITIETGLSSSSLSLDDFNGELKGMLTVRDETIPEFANDIDRLAYQLATDVNALHATGTDQDGNTGQDIFSITISGSTSIWEGAAASIRVNFEDPALVAAGTTGLTGDNSLCLDMVELRDAEVIDGATYTEEYSRLAAKIGLLVSSNEQKLTNSEELLNSIQEDRDEVAGVSTDEEMLMLVQYQTGYEAAANYLTVVREMLDTLLTIV